MRAIDHLERSDTYRAAGAMHQLNAFRQQVIEPVLHDRVRLAATDLHDDPGPRLNTPDLVDYLARDTVITVLVKVFHFPAPFSAV
jgi:hypothetical protein